jgi:fructoselysine transporter
MEELKPQRELGLLQTSSIIIGSVIGSGVFINLPIVAKYAGSPLTAVIIWCIGGLLWIPQILILAEMGTAYPSQGGPYYFLYKAGSPFFAFLYTWTAFLTSDTPTLTIIGLSAASALTFFFPILAAAVPAKIFAAVLIVILAALQFRSVRTGGNVQVLLTGAKLLPLVILVVIGMFYLGTGNLSFRLPIVGAGGNSLFTQATAGISATLWAYAGFLNILYMAGEVKNPERTLPRSLIGSIFFVLIGYTLISLCVGAIVPFADLLKAEGQFINPFAFLGFFSQYSGAFFAVAAFISMVGVLNAVIMTQPRLEYAMARDGLFFEIFGKLHPKYLTPYFSIMIQATIAIILFLLGNIDNLLGYFTLSYVLQNTLVYTSIFFLHRREDYKPTYRVRFWRLMATLSIVIQLYIAWGTFIAYPLWGALACLGLIVSGMPVYWYFYAYKARKKLIEQGMAKT